MNPLIPPAIGLIVLFSYKDGFGIKSPMMFDMPLNKGIKPICTIIIKFHIESEIAFSLKVS